MTTGKELINRPTGELVAITPGEVVENATVQAKLLMNIVEQTKCYQQISGKKYLQVEAWETIGAFNRVHAETESITPFVVNGETIGYQARVQLWKDGIVIGGSIMPCFFTENCCKGKEGDAKHKACMSAAQTFATSKAYRMNYSYVAILAGYQPMPAEEITEDMAKEVLDKSQHWCKDHDTAFFMRGKMKSYAHPIKDAQGNDTGEWCHEHKEAQVIEAMKLSPLKYKEVAIPPEHDKSATTWTTSAKQKELKALMTAQKLDAGFVIGVCKRLGLPLKSDLMSEEQLDTLIKELSTLPSGVNINSEIFQKE